MGAFCLPKHLVSKMKTAIQDGTLHPDKLVKMTSEQRRGLFTKLIGEENAKGVNLAFEQKLLLKNQEAAMVTWARDTLGLTAADKHAVAEKIKATYAEKKRRTFTPAEDEAALDEIVSDVFSRRYKTDVSLAEAQRITELSRDAKNAYDNLETGKDFEWKSDEDQLKSGVEYGVKRAELEEYLGGLKEAAEKRVLVNPLKEKGLIPKLDVVMEDVAVGVKTSFQVARKLASSFVDNSLWGNQVAPVMMDYKTTGIWWKNTKKSLVDIVSTLKGGAVRAAEIRKAAKALTYSETLSLNGAFENKGGVPLSLWRGEEDIPTGIFYGHEKTGILAPLKTAGEATFGRLESAADMAQEIGGVRVRIEVAKQMYKMYENLGFDIKDTKVRSDVNTMVNSMTGRGDLGILESQSEWLNLAVFSARLFKSNLDVMSGHIFNRSMNPRMRADAGKRLLRIAAATAVIQVMAASLGKVFDKEGTTELNPLSSDFLKISVGDTSYGIPFVAKAASIITLLARLATQKTKSTTTGITTELGEDYGSKNGMDLLLQFASNKASPATRILIDYIRGSTFDGQEPTIWGELKSLTPMGISTHKELWGDKTTNEFIKTLGSVFSYFGIPVGSYTVPQSDAEKKFDEINSLEGEEQQTMIDQIKASDPDMWKDIQQVGKDQSLGITPLDKAIKNMGVEDGERAKFIYQEMEKLETPEEKAAYWDSLVTKGIFQKTEKGKYTENSQKVVDQLKDIKTAGSVKAYEKSGGVKIAGYGEESDEEVYNKNEVIKELEITAAEVDSEKSMIELAKLYVEAAGVDPLTAVQTLFTEEQLKSIRGGTVIMERIVQGVDENSRVDHIVPLGLGGDNSEDNLRTVSVDVWAANTPVEVYLIGLLEQGIITENEGAIAIKGFKDGILVALKKDGKVIGLRYK